ncbi:hypothetical protein GQ44DRAFT_706908 [Phaeosphaeriaceae sp. PMI808]|nr:hypothetical protein GQ44DRAFT_706908 [Phaeosphaeriaceae sp. PMI808]
MTSLREESALSDYQNSHKRKQHEYTYRLPTPPRIVVPPPSLAIDMPGLNIDASGEGTEYDLAFLKEMNLNDTIEKNTLMEWAYERRRQAQMILPWLYLGPMVAAKDHAFLTREGITMVLAIRARENSMMGAINAARQVCAEVATIEVPTFHQLICRFAETSRMINMHVAQHRQTSLKETGQPTLGKVLVFCESGNEKAAAIVAAYMMTTLTEFDHVQAMQVCQAQRFCVNFDDILKNMLRSYWDILQARRLVAADNAAALIDDPQGSANMKHHDPIQPHTSAKSKRTIDHLIHDDDVDMEGSVDPSDALRFAGRDVTPFQDRHA